MIGMIGMKVLSILISTAMLTGCGAAAGAGGGTEAQASVVQTEEVAASALSDIADTDDMFSSRDLDPGYDESQAVTVRLTGDTAVCDSDAVTVDGGTVTVTAAGTYVLSGTLTDGQIVVRAGEADKVQLVLNGVDITCSDSAAIYAVEADKVFLTLADGTENSLTNGGTYAAIDENNIDAVIFAKTDLTLNGTGSLTVSAAAGHGIVCKDDLVIAGGTCTIDAASHALRARTASASQVGRLSSLPARTASTQRTMTTPRRAGCISWTAASPFTPGTTPSTRAATWSSGAAASTFLPAARAWRADPSPSTAGRWISSPPTTASTPPGAPTAPTLRQAAATSPTTRRAPWS